MTGNSIIRLEFVKWTFHESQCITKSEFFILSGSEVFSHFLSITEPIGILLFLEGKYTVL